MRRFDSLNPILVTVTSRLWGRHEQRLELLEHAVKDGSPDNLWLYFYALAGTWLLLAPAFGLLMVAAAYLADKADGNQGNTIALTVGVFPLVFCIAGAVDAAWRMWVSQAARRRYRRESGHLDARTRRLMKLARINDGSFILQTLVAAWFAWRVG